MCSLPIHAGQCWRTLASPPCRVGCHPCLTPDGWNGTTRLELLGDMHPFVLSIHAWTHMHCSGIPVDDAACPQQGDIAPCSAYVLTAAAIAKGASS